MSAELMRLSAELERHSGLLLEAIAASDPGYLEHLENREATLKAIRRELQGECASEALWHLGRALELGNEARERVQRLRDRTWSEFTQLRQERQLAEGLARLAEPGYAALDLEG